MGGKESKKTANSSHGKTKTVIKELATEEIYMELARMLGGAEITPAVVQNAKEMKLLADKIKTY